MNLAAKSWKAVKLMMLMAARDLQLKHPAATREQIRAHLSGNYCRCTGYQAIVDAIEEVLHGKS